MSYFWWLWKPLVPSRKCQEVAPTYRAATMINLCSRCLGRHKHSCDQHRPVWNHPYSWRAGRPWRVLSAFYKQLSQFLLWPAERKTVYVKKCVNSLEMFPIWTWIETNSIEAWFVIVMKTISVRFENHFRHISATTVQKFRTNLLCTVILNTCGSSLRNIFPVNFPVERNLCGLYICVKFENILFSLFGIELK
jgi:hypothetical protein